MKLWRGDTTNTTNKGYVHEFRTEGIVTKQLLNGDPDYIQRRRLWEAVQDHVAPCSEAQDYFSATSSFLSFTSSEEAALRFAAGPQRNKLVPCADYEETAVVFELNLRQMKETARPHVYIFHYTCNYRLVKPNSPHPSSARVASLVSCEFCNSAPKEHTLLLIDVPGYLRANPNSAARADALACSERDSEWLVLPVDYVARLNGFQSRIPPADFWRARLFRTAT
ncbi:MAG TPA: hypothetical protein VMV72_14200 [Verrucomicrobiae bacterium]|nr:hypothetical protein [Verrucomicrobiae bacterium]